MKTGAGDGLFAGLDNPSRSLERVSLRQRLLQLRVNGDGNRVAGLPFGSDDL